MPVKKGKKEKGKQQKERKLDRKKDIISSLAQYTISSCVKKKKIFKMRHNITVRRNMWFAL